MRSKFLPLAVAALAGLLPLRADAQAQLNLADVQLIISQAVSRAVEVSPNAVIAVVDNNGFVLGVWSASGTVPTIFAVGGAVREAGTAAFLSSDQSALSSRTAQFIIQQNFPPGVKNIGPGPLVGVAFSNLCILTMKTDVNRFKGPDAVPGAGFVPGSLGVGVQNTRLSGRGSSATLYKNGTMVGGIGVYPDPNATLAQDLAQTFSIELSNMVNGGNVEEDVALAGTIGFEPASNITANNILANGIRFPYVLGVPQITTRIPFANLPGAVVAPYTLRTAPPYYPFPTETFNGQTGQYYYPIIADPNPGLINGVPRLTAAEVHNIVANGAIRASTTRAAIRFPVGVPMQCWVTVVGNPNVNGAPPPVLAAFRTPNAPMFSFDVAVQKGRTALFFSSPVVAQSSRTVGFLAQDFYPPGLNSSPPSIYGPEQSLNGQPSFNGLQIQFSLPPPLGYAPNPNLPNGITVFPGGFPLYRIRGDGVPVLVGAVGISGDGVDQDDIVGSSATVGYQAPLNVRADSFIVGGARLPYAKFPRNADVGND